MYECVKDPNENNTTATTRGSESGFTKEAMDAIQEELHGDIEMEADDVSQDDAE